MYFNWMLFSYRFVVIVLALWFVTGLSWTGQLTDCGLQMIRIKSRPYTRCGTSSVSIPLICFTDTFRSSCVCSHCRPTLESGQWLCVCVCFMGCIGCCWLILAVAVCVMGCIGCCWLLRVCSNVRNSVMTAWHCCEWWLVTCPLCTFIYFCVPLGPLRHHYVPLCTFLSPCNYLKYIFKQQQCVYTSSVHIWNFRYVNVRIGECVQLLATFSSSSFQQWTAYRTVLLDKLVVAQRGKK
jgi:hypothetical protein